MYEISENYWRGVRIEIDFTFDSAVNGWFNVRGWVQRDGEKTCALFLAGR